MNNNYLYNAIRNNAPTGNANTENTKYNCS